jgi:hypothetical protein
MEDGHYEKHSFPLDFINIPGWPSLDSYKAKLVRIGIMLSFNLKSLMEG